MKEIIFQEVDEGRIQENNWIFKKVDVGPEVSSDENTEID